MKLTIKQVQENSRNLTAEFRSYGHWKISMDYKGKRISTVTTNSVALDDWKSDIDEKDSLGRNRSRQGYLALCEEIIDSNL